MITGGPCCMLSFVAAMLNWMPTTGSGETLTEAFAAAASCHALHTDITFLVDASGNCECLDGFVVLTDKLCSTNGPCT